MATTTLNGVPVQSLINHDYPIGDIELEVRLMKFVKVKRLSVLTGVAKAIPSVLRFTRRGGQVQLPQTAATLRNFSGVALESEIKTWSRHAAFVAAGLSLVPHADGDTVVYRGTCVTPAETELIVRTIVGFVSALEAQRRRLLTAKAFSYATFTSLAYRGCYAGVVGTV